MALAVGETDRIASESGNKEEKERKEKEKEKKEEKSDEIVANDKLAIPALPRITNFLSFEAPLNEATLTLKYELPLSLKQVIDAFRRIVFEDFQKLKIDSSLKEFNTFESRVMTLNQRSKLNVAKNFIENEEKHNCEIINFKAVLLPLLGNKDELTEKKNDNDNSWTSLNSWTNWGKSWLSAESWTDSLSKWTEILNLPMTANERWKIDWDINMAVSMVESQTMRSMVCVDEISQIIQMQDAIKDKDKDNQLSHRTIFVKKLFVHAKYVTIPQFVINIMTSQYTDDSNHQMNVICQLMSNNDTK